MLIGYLFDIIFLHLSLTYSEFDGLLGLTLGNSLLLIAVYLSKISVFILIALCFYVGGSL